HIFELAVAQIVVEDIPTEARYINVRQAIIVVIHHRDPHSPAFPGKAGLFSDVYEMEIAVLAEQTYHRIPAVLSEVVNIRAPSHQNVELSIVVTVDESHSAARRLDDVALFR